MKLKQKAVKVGSIIYTLGAKDGLIKKKSAWAQCDHVKRAITYDSDATPQNVLTCIVHEALEAIVNQRELKITHRQITSLEDAVTALLVDNSDLFSTLVSETRKEHEDIYKGRTNKKDVEKQNRGKS